MKNTRAARTEVQDEIVQNKRSKRNRTAAESVRC
jgi:hypothetical protein